MTLQAKHKKLIIAAVILVVLTVGLLLGARYILDKYRIATVYVEGNVHYSEEEIKQLVMQGPLGDNSLYLSYKYKKKDGTDTELGEALRERISTGQEIPFVDYIEVTRLAPDTIKIRVEEKAVAGFVRYMDSCMYFNREGYVVESSQIKTVGIPEIIGLDFDYVTLGEKLPVEQESVFETIMQVKNLLNKYELIVDKIYIRNYTDITLYFGKVRVSLGENKNLEEKVMDLPEILISLVGKRGVLRMENYSAGEKSPVFEIDTNDTQD